MDKFMCISCCKIFKNPGSVSHQVSPAAVSAL